MPKSREELLDSIRSIRGVRKDFINFLRSKGLRIPLNATWDQIFDIVLSSRKIRSYDLELFLINIVGRKRTEEIYEEERIVERRRYKRVKTRESTTNVSYAKGMSLEKEFEYLVGLLGFEHKRWVGGAGGEVGDYEVRDTTTGEKLLISCKNTKYVTVKHVNDLYANAIAFNYKHAVLIVGEHTKVLEGAVERAKYLGIPIIGIDELRRNLLSRKNLRDKVEYLKTMLFGTRIKLEESVKTSVQRKRHKRLGGTFKQPLNVEGIVVEPLPNSLDDLHSALVRKHMGFLRRNISIHIDKYILYLIPYYEIEYEGRVRIGRSYNSFNGKIVINATDGELEALSIEEFVDSPDQLKEPYQVRLKSLYKIIGKANEKFLMSKVKDYIVKLETRYYIYREGLLTTEEKVISLRDILEEEEIIDLDEALDILETNYDDSIEKEYVPRKTDIEIIHKQLYYIPYWCVDYTVSPKNERKTAWMLASVSETEVYVEPCPWK